MSNCQFKQVHLNESVLLDANPMYCYHCNEQASYHANAIYKGHSEFNGIVYDVFQITFSCPSCKRNVEYYIEPCRDKKFVWDIGILQESPFTLDDVRKFAVLPTPDLIRE